MCPPAVHRLVLNLLVCALVGLLSGKLCEQVLFAGAGTSSAAMRLRTCCALVLCCPLEFAHLSGLRWLGQQQKSEATSHIMQAH